MSHRLLARAPWTVVLVGVVMLNLAGKGKNKPQPTDSGSSGFGGGFVEIDMSEEEEELDAQAYDELTRTTADCGDLLKLEPSALMGQLTESQIRCLDDALKVAERQTVKDKINRVLLKDAWAKGDEHRWEAIAMRHVTEINRSDPDMCYKLASYLVYRGPERMDEAMKWADTALENRSLWEGDEYVKRVYTLYKYKTMAAEKKWTYLEQEYSQHPSEELGLEAQEARNNTKTAAREWLDYARESGRDETLPKQFCVSAAGTTDFCEQ